MASLGIAPRDPHVVCDRCGAIGSIYTRSGDVTQYWLRKRRIRGWSTKADADVRVDICPSCIVTAAADDGGEEKR